MKRKIFYSWQSDLENSTNRSFIENALKNAIKRITKDDSLYLEPVLDRDTIGLSGSPAIAEAIFEKIALSDVFVCDVSIINPRSSKRKSPNPNVLFELGYAVTKLGWDRIILVQNTAFGTPDTLPFDIHGRRTVLYKALPSFPERSHIRKELSNKLEQAIKAALEPTKTRLISASVPLWWGFWELANGGSFHKGKLFIREVGSRSFLFHLKVYKGSHTGVLNSSAIITGSDSAYSRIQTKYSPDGTDRLCEISFKRDLKDGRRKITIKEEGWCPFHGAGVTFNGIFLRQNEFIFDIGYLDELDLSRLYSITGQFYEPLMHRFQVIGKEENLDQFLADVFTGGVRGLYTIMEGIIMRGENGQLWIAFIDDEEVRYFTTENEYRHKLPKTIENWRGRFKEKKVIFDSSVDRIPTSPRY